MGLYRSFAGVGKQWEGCKDLILTYSSLHVIEAAELSTNWTVTLAFYDGCRWYNMVCIELEYWLICGAKLFCAAEIKKKKEKKKERDQGESLLVYWSSWNWGNEIKVFSWFDHLIPP